MCGPLLHVPWFTHYRRSTRVRGRSARVTRKGNGLGSFAQPGTGKEQEFFSECELCLPGVCTGLTWSFHFAVSHAQRSAIYSVPTCRELTSGHKAVKRHADDPNEKKAWKVLQACPRSRRRRSTPSSSAAGRGPACFRRSLLVDHRH